MKERIPFLAIAITSALIFISVAWQTEPPAHLISSSFSQLLLFFLPLATFLFSVLNVFLNRPIKSFIICSSLILLLVLKGIGFLNAVSLALLVFVTVLLLFFTNKTQEKRNYSKIPKLSQLSKQH